MNKITAKTPYIKQGNVDVYDFGTFKFHVYNSNDVMADTSFIIEGKDALVTMDEPFSKLAWRNLILTLRVWANR